VDQEIQALEVHAVHLLRDDFGRAGEELLGARPVEGQERQREKDGGFNVQDTSSSSQSSKANYAEKTILQPHFHSVVRRAGKSSKKSDP
jgi:hypothetical protein